MESFILFIEFLMDLQRKKREEEAKGHDLKLLQQLQIMNKTALKEEKLRKEERNQVKMKAKLKATSIT